MIQKECRLEMLAVFNLVFQLYRSECCAFQSGLPEQEVVASSR